MKQIILAFPMHKYYSSIYVILGWLLGVSGNAKNVFIGVNDFFFSHFHLGKEIVQKVRAALACI